MAIPRHPQSSIANHAISLGLKRDRAKVRSIYQIIRELREIRIKSGRPRKNVANEIGIHLVQLSRWERGETMPRLRDFFYWVEALGFRLHLSK
jgi:DNA-binding XRE family transcriptional regulator